MKYSGSLYLSAVFFYKIFAVYRFLFIFVLNSIFFILRLFFVFFIMFAAGIFIRCVFL